MARLFYFAVILSLFFSSTIAFPRPFLHPHFLPEDLSLFQLPFSRSEMIPPFYLKKILDNYRPPISPVTFIIIEDDNIGEGETRDVKFPSTSTLPPVKEIHDEVDPAKETAIDVTTDSRENFVIPPRTLEFPFLAKFLDRLERTSTAAPETTDSPIVKASKGTPLPLMDTADG